MRDKGAYAGVKGEAKKKPRVNISLYLLLFTATVYVRRKIKRGLFASALSMGTEN